MTPKKPRWKSPRTTITMLPSVGRPDPELLLPLLRAMLRRQMLEQKAATEGEVKPDAPDADLGSDLP